MMPGTVDHHRLGCGDWPADNISYHHRCSFFITKGLDKSSHQIASEFDAISDGEFYYREGAMTGAPFTANDEVCDTVFMFRYKADCDKFLEIYIYGDGKLLK